MVDEAAFKRILSSADPHACTFGRALLSGCCACSLADRQCIAEREAPVCRVPAARAACGELLDLLRHKSLFAIREPKDAAPLTHAQNMKIQCGGLHGLQREVDGSATVNDVAALVAAAKRKFGAADRFPYQNIVRAVAAYLPRHRHRQE